MSFSLQPGVRRAVRFAQVLALGAMLTHCGDAVDPATCTCCPLDACCYNSAPPAGTTCSLGPSPNDAGSQSGRVLVSSGSTRYCVGATPPRCPVSGPLSPPELYLA
ncbi:MAG: hypothetical protein Q8Q09_06990 [Deltaproteobacteria bacterium]|nr:hypothetical protein [Deltaproteobacteria bacterium]